MTSKTVTEVLERTAQLIQRSNQWTTNKYERVNTDSQGKTRTCRCLAGAVLVAAGLNAEHEDGLEANKLTRRVRSSLLKTLKSDPEAFGVNDEVNTNALDGIEEFNDSGVAHSDVVRLVNATIDRIENRG